MEVDRGRYAALFGPTTGDRIRLADTDLLIEVDRGPQRVGGDEAVFGGGKVIRESMGQSTGDPRRGHARPRDHRRGDPRPLGHRQGRHRRARRAHRRHRQGRQPRHDGRRRPGARDRPVHRDPRRATARSSPPAPSTATCTSSARSCSTRRSASGITTIIGGGTGPAEGTKATTVTPGSWNTGLMLQALDDVADQRGAARQGQHRVARRDARAAARRGRRASSCTRTGARRRRSSTRACGCATSRACRWRSTPTRSTRPATCESTLAAIAGRTIHTYHTEGAGGGHAPDIITVVVAAERAAVVDQPDPARTRSTRSTSTSTCSWCATTSTRRSPRTSRSPRAASGRRRSPPRTCCTTSAPSR